MQCRMKGNEYQMRISSKLQSSELSSSSLNDSKLTPLQRAIIKAAADLFGFEDEFKTSREHLDSFSRLQTPIDKFLAFDK
jgi:hypothetical protein